MHSTLVISVLVARTMQVATVLLQNQVRAIYMILTAIASAVSGYHIDDNQYVQFAANYYNAEQDSDYASDPSVKNALPELYQPKPLKA